MKCFINIYYLFKNIFHYLLLFLDFTFQYSQQIFWHKFYNKLKINFKNYSNLFKLLGLQQESKILSPIVNILCLSFFNIEKSNDTAWRYGIIKKLLAVNINGRLVNFLHNFLENRFMQVKIQDKLFTQYQLQNRVQ